jgi:hypothetical protein
MMLMVLPPDFPNSGGNSNHLMKEISWFYNMFFSPFILCANNFFFHCLGAENAHLRHSRDQMGYWYLWWF